MKNLSETHGIELIRRIAFERFRVQGLKTRVWSEEMKCWGFFSDRPNELDVMLILGCAKSGDMFRLENYGSPLFTMTMNEIQFILPNNNTFVVLDLQEIELQNTPFYGLRLLSSQPSMTCQLLARQSSMFKIAWDYL